MLKIQNLSVIIKNRTILDNINLKIGKAEIVSLLGPSGSGKTTLLRVIMGLEKPATGSILLDDKILTEGKKQYVRPEKRNFSLVFQEFILFPHLDVYKNVAIGLDHLEKTARRTVVTELLALFEIEHLARQRIDTLSGGEQQRVALARSLALRPAILMLDEPFSNLDQRMKERLYGQLKTVLQQYAITTIFATHDHAEAFYFSDRIHVLKEGRVRDSNTPFTLYMQPATPWIASFVGEVNYVTGSELKTLYGVNSGLVKDGALYLIRPEEFRIVREADGAGSGSIEQVEFYGFYRTIVVSMANGRKLRIKDFHQEVYAPGTRVNIRVDKSPEAILLTETGDEQALKNLKEKKE